MKQALSKLHPYPFEKLTALKDGIMPASGCDPIALSIGEPRHPTPAIISEAIISHLHGTSNYPTTRGTDSLRQAIVDWLCRRFSLPQDSLSAAANVLPVNGTREALFSIAQCVLEPASASARVLMPNPFYQIYEGAALLAGGEPYYLNCSAENGWLPDYDALPDSVWNSCQLLYLCNPGNPTGAVTPLKLLQALIDRAERHDFIIASDECYSELYPDEDKPPAGLLQAAAAMGNSDYRRCLVFHSLSKRSNAPGIRSGFVAGDAAILKDYLRYRTYHGCTMAPFIQAASTVAWQDETHVIANRTRYRQKFDQVLDLLDGCLQVSRPDAGFYLWPQTPGDDEGFARELYRQQNITVLPGSYLGRSVDGNNPGSRHVRMALVATLEECLAAAERIRDFLN